MDQEVHFDNIKPTIQSELSKAKEFIYIAVAWLTDDDLFKDLVYLSKKGIRIQLIINDDFINQNSNLDYSILYRNGGLLFFMNSENNLMHNKFCIIDNKTVLNGSYNWTRKAIKNFENITITRDKTICIQFVEQFNKLKEQSVAYFEKVIGESDKSLTELDIENLNFEELISRAKKRKENGNYLACQYDLQAAMKLNPNEKGIVLFDLAYCQYELKNFKSSLENYTDYLEIHPNSSEALNNRGLVYEELEEYLLGVEDFTRAIELDSNNSLYYENRANIQQKLIPYYKGKQKKPLNTIKVIEYTGEFNFATISKEYLFWTNPNLEKLIYQSIDDYIKVIKKNPEDNNDNLVAIIAESYYELKQYEKSIIYFTRLINSNSSNEYAYYSRALLNFLLDRLENAISDIDKALEIHPNFSHYKELRNSIKTEKRKFKNWFK